MSEFERTYQPIDFGETDDSPIEIVLKFKDDFEGTWERNENNTLRFSEMKRLFAEIRTCYFQKQQHDEKRNRSRHKIFVPIDNDKAIEMSVVLWQNKIDEFHSVNSYFAVKSKEIVFIQPPQKDVIEKKCSFRFASVNSNDGTNDPKFEDLYNRVEELSIPTIDINKEQDKQIWDNYVNALKKLIKQKEIVWKIKKVGRSYTNKDNRDDRATYVDIAICEDDLNKLFEEDLVDMFADNELSDYGVNKDSAFVEFDTYRVLSDNELSRLSSIAADYFFEPTQDSPINTISGELRFKYTDEKSKQELYNEIKQRLSDDYGFDNLTIGTDGAIDVNETESQHITKCIEDNFAGIATVERHDDMVLKVSLIGNSTLRQIQTVLNQNGLDRAKAFISKDKTQLVVEVSAYVDQNILSNFGLKLETIIRRFGNNAKTKHFVEIDGLEIIDDEYQTTQQINAKEILDKIQDKNEDFTIKPLPTRFFFGFVPEQKIAILRDIKTKTDLKGKSVFDIKKSELTVSADSTSDYQSQIQRIKAAMPDIEIEDKPFKPSFFIRLNTESEELRKSVAVDIQNNLRKDNLNAEYDSVKEHKRVAFSYNFQSEDERDAFKAKLSEKCQKLQHLLTLSFENEYGHTTYEFVKNEILENEKEKETLKNVRRASFVFLTQKENEALQKEIEKYGDDARFSEGVQIGVLVKKLKNKLTFKITNDFDDFMVDDNKDALNNGFVKPIFPGELTNISRMIRAMAKVTHPGEYKKGFGHIGFPANNNLPNFLFDPSFARISSLEMDDVKSQILQNLNEPLLANNSKQLVAVAKALIALDMALIQGPPGTGKTTVIAEIIWQTLLKNPESKILITSQTNLAVDNALERLRGKKLVRPIRIGNIEKFEDEGKMYSTERIKAWTYAKINSEEEVANQDNAIKDWINNIGDRCDSNNEYAEIVKTWKEGLTTLKDSFSTAYLKHVNVFAATCSECGSRNFLNAYQSMFPNDSESTKEPIFDLVIMDEASKATPPELVLPLTLGKKVIIIGDHKQLPPMLDEKEFGEALEAIGAKDLVENWTRQDYKTSQFEKLFVNAPNEIVASLDTQFRMHEQIMDCISQFYKDQVELEDGLQCGIIERMDNPVFSDRASRWHGFNLQPFITPNDHAIWVNVDTPEKKVGTSYLNQGEVDAILTVISALTKADGYKEYSDFFKNDEIGIITYYMPQMDKIRKTIYEGFSPAEWRNFEQHKYKNKYQIPFRINTVDRFQGMERNIIIVSTVRSNIQVDESGCEHENTNYPFALGFARELQRINVGFSRAKRLLIVVGNEKHFAHKREYKEAISKMHRIDIKQLKNL